LFLVQKELTSFIFLVLDGELGEMFDEPDVSIAISREWLYYSLISTVHIIACEELDKNLHYNAEYDFLDSSLDYTVSLEESGRPVPKYVNTMLYFHLYNNSGA
ncbi:19425_t:CDS:2, partial [Dentiscutata erythropus]